MMDFGKPPKKRDRVQLTAKEQSGIDAEAARGAATTRIRIDSTENYPASPHPSYGIVGPDEVGRYPAPATDEEESDAQKRRGRNAYTSPIP